MHELSIVTGIIDIAVREAEKAGATLVEEIELDIGCLTTVEMMAFDLAWKQAVKGTILESCVTTVNRIAGKARCLDCETLFELEQLYDPCPGCGGHLLDIQDGKQLRVRSLIVS